ncbi:MAG TPA: hypothetical protein VMX55_05665 [candidate division Zixibacteria bacterium]|nr:hypothetical protein [candidate division Zixibacteria bacterium]
MSAKQKIRVHPRTILNHLTPKMLYGLFIKEIIYIRKFKQILKQIGWSYIKIKPYGFAANGSLIYLLLKILNEKHPDKILELGSGETTKLTYRYISENENTEALVLEDNSEWYNKLIGNFKSKRFNYTQSLLKELTVAERICNWYSYDFSNEKNNSKYNLILIDGPLGTLRYSRLGIIKFLPNILDRNNFIIIFDDTSRKGEQDTIGILKNVFAKEKIEFISVEVYGYKKQTCLASKNYHEFLSTI